MTDFSKFDKTENTFERKGGYTVVKEQEYSNLKYRKAPKKQKNEDGTTTEVVEGRFYVANERFKACDLANPDKGLCQFTAPDGDVLIAVVAAKDATILKASKKSKDGNKVKNFKSPKLEAALEKLGIIDTTKVGVNQFVDLTSVGTSVTIKGVSCFEAFSLTKGVAKEKPAAEAVATEQALKGAVPASNASAKDDWN